MQIKCHRNDLVTGLVLGQEYSDTAGEGGRYDQRPEVWQIVIFPQNTIWYSWYPPCVKSLHTISTRFKKLNSSDWRLIMILSAKNNKEKNFPWERFSSNLRGEFSNTRQLLLKVCWIMQSKRDLFASLEFLYSPALVSVGQER